jgi:tetratricopeptide (TPR) repeat protein
MIAEEKAAPRDWPFTFSIRLGNAILSYARYIGEAFWPARLALMILHPGFGLRWWQVWASLVFLIAVTVFVAAERSRRYLTVGWLWLLGTMLPTIGLIQIDLHALADRYAYIAFVGLFLMVCWGLADLAERQHLPGMVLPAVSLVVLLLLSVLTRHQVGFWKDRITLWTHTLDVTHRNWVADVRLGYEYRRRGQLEQALVYYYQAAEDKPSDPLININIAMSEHQLGNYRQAIQYYEKVLAVSKDNATIAQVYANMRHAYSDLGDQARARQCYEAALRPRPAPPPRAKADWRHDPAEFIRERVKELRPDDTSLSEPR